MMSFSTGMPHISRNDPFTAGKISSLSGEQSKLESKVMDLERDVYRMALYVQTILAALVKENLVSPERLKELTEQIDLSDGEADGRFDHEKGIGDLARNGVECPCCARLNRRDRAFCLYCGEKLPAAGEWLSIPKE